MYVTRTRILDYDIFITYTKISIYLIIQNIDIYNLHTQIKYLLKMCALNNVKYY